MKDVKILHTADLHLASSFEGLPPSMGNIRRRDLVQTLGRLTDMCRERQTDLLIIAGDFWQSHNITRPLVDFIADQFRKIPATQVVISPGVADYYSDNSYYSFYPWPENIHIFTQEVSVLPLPHLNLQVIGWAWSADGPNAQDLINCALSSVRERTIVVAYGSPESLALPDELVQAESLVYTAFGGAHRHTVWGERGMDPGCPEPLQFSDEEAKGVLVGTVGTECKLELVRCNTRNMLQWEVILAGCSGLNDVVARVKTELVESRSEDFFSLKLIGVRPRGQWDLTKLGEAIGYKYVIFQDATDISYDLKALEAEHSHGVLGKFIRSINSSDEDDQVKKQALAQGLAALLGGGRLP